MSLRSTGLRMLFFLLAPAVAAATTYTFPGAAPCNGLLQACIDGVANGSRIEIATETPIAEDISVYDRSLTLTAATGFLPALASGHSLSVTSSSIAGSLAVSVSHLRFTDGYVFANYNGSSSANYDFEDLVLTRVGNDSANYIEVNANGGTLNATLVNNRLSGVPRSLNSGLVQLNANGATLNASAYYNHVTSTIAGSIAGAGIFVDVYAAGAGTMKLHGNEVRGSFARAGIYLSEGLFSSTASSFNARVYNNVAICAGTDSSGGGGIGFVANNGSIDVQAYNNTAANCYDGISALQWFGGGSGASISGSVKNNLVVAGRGLEFAPALTASLSNDYNLINAGMIATVGLGSHSLTAPAQLVLNTQPRLRPGSPAIDAADTVALGFGLLLNNLPTNDADGLRRIKGASSKADIGAYEAGDTSFTHIARSDTLAGNFTVLGNPALDGNVGALPLATPNYNIGGPGGVSYNHPFGAFYDGSKWALFNQDLAAIPLGAHFDVMVPASGSGLFVHVSSASNAAGYATTLSDSSTDNLPERIVLITQNWSAGGGVYNAHPAGVYYGSDSKWHVANIDGAAMQTDLGFDVYAQQASPNVFRVTAAAGNLNSASLRLDNVLLDNTPCARPQVTRLLGGGPVSGNFDVDYELGKWYVYGYGGIAVGEQFHVLIDPAQVFDCRDRIFADSFD